jgi:hypothetical protein
MPTAAEMAESLAGLAESDPTGFAVLASALEAHRKPRHDQKPGVRRVPIYPPGELNPVEVWTVDLPGWLAAGATETLGEARIVKVRVDQERAEAEAAAAKFAAEDEEARLKARLEELEARKAPTAKPAPGEAVADDGFEALKAQWREAFPGRKLHGRKSAATMRKELAEVEAAAE